MLKYTADPRSTVFLKSLNPFDLLQKSTICALFKGKSVDLKNYHLLRLIYVFQKNVLKIMIGKSVGVNLRVRMCIVCNADQLRKSNLECLVLLLIKHAGNI